MDITVAWEEDWVQCFGKKMQRREATVEEEWNGRCAYAGSGGYADKAKTLDGLAEDGWNATEILGRRKLHSGQDTIQRDLRASPVDRIGRRVPSDSDETRRAGAASREENLYGLSWRRELRREVGEMRSAMELIHSSW